MNPVDESKRAFLRDGGLFALTVSVPGWVFSGCSNTSDTSSPPMNPAWEARASQLVAASGVIFTQANPGKWAGKEALHVPTATFAAGSVTVTTPHVMTADHYITTHFIKSNAGIVVGLKEYQPTDPKPEVTFTLAPGTTTITLFSNCNLHGLWDNENLPT